MTKLFEMSREERQKELETMDINRLFAELDDTIQFDIVKASTEKWTAAMHNEKKVYHDIVKELQKRIK